MVTLSGQLTMCLLAVLLLVLLALLVLPIPALFE
jgi:hypothetical protein